MPRLRQKRQARSYRGLIYTAGVLATTTLVVAGIAHIVAGVDGAPKHMVQQVVHLNLLPPPPPPPPPPPEKQIEQPKMREPEIRPDKVVDKPPPKAEAPPPGPLALDAKGEGPGDAFGLGGRPGGADYAGGGSVGSRFGWYASLLQTRIQDQLQRDERVNAAKVDVVLRVWLNGDGSAGRLEFVRRSGEASLDQAVEADVLSMPRLSDAPPADMPQPIHLRIAIKPSTQQG